jgi:hypothetical protein
MPACACDVPVLRGESALDGVESSDLFEEVEARLAVGGVWEVGE